MIRVIALLTLLVLALCAHATPVEVPAVAELAAPKAATTVGPPSRGRGASETRPIDTVSVAAYAPGQRNEFGVAIDARLATAYAAFDRGEPEAVLAAFDGKNAEPSEAAWLAESLRFEALLRLGRAADAEVLAEQLAAVEMRLIQTNISARAMRGVARMALGRFDEAQADLAQVAAAIGTWSMPIAYTAPPSNGFALMSFTSAQLRAYTGMAVIHARRGEYAPARDWAQAAEGLYRDFYFVRMHPFYGTGNVSPEAAFGRAFNLATLGFAQGMLAGADASVSAIMPLQAAQRFFSARRHAFGQSVAQAYLAQAALSSGRIDEAVALSEQGERFAAQAGLPDMIWQFALRRGEAELKRGNADRAEAAFRSAQTGIDALSGVLASDEARLRFGAGKEEVTRQLTRVDRARGDFAALFRDLERGRARAFVDLLQGVPLARGRQPERVGRIRALDQELRATRLKNLAGAAQSVDGLLRSRAAAVADLRSADPELADALGVAAAELAPVLRSLREGETLAYAIPDLAQEPLVWLLVTNAGARIHTSAISESALQRLLTQFTAARELRSGARQKNIVATLSEQLGIQAMAGANTKALYVVASGATHFLPWGALSVDVPVAVLPLGGWLLRDTVKLAKPGSAAVVGDPEFGGALPQLTGARNEAGEVARVYGVSALIGAAATEAELRRAIGSGVNTLHLATHGYFRDEAPLDSGFVLTAAGRPHYMTAASLIQSPLPARIVVLSACETGVGEAVAGDDFLGLTRSFYLGGSVAVMASLWPVEDEPTQRFMRTFHQQLGKTGLGAAWLAARNQLRQDGAAPASYGAFVLGGALR